MHTFTSVLPHGIKNALIGYKEGDMPLLDELGINFDSIKKDSLRIVFVKSKGHEDTMDMVGPLLFIFLYGFILFLRGTVHIGYLYYLSTLSCMFIYTITVLMNNSRVSLMGIINALGYALIPVLAFATISRLLPGGKGFALLIGSLFSIWSTAVSTNEITRRFQIERKGVLIGYPIFLVYTCFMMLSTM
ncbi:protein YIPF5/7 [Nematocida ausubeli]|uniref:Protein YIP n=1 Tax=Nematocida ausubeli (strain ATCC PRA-371 / ERTm2) TaxID=1913371 RepID=H8Z9C8_NEMA1|nr:hypothetical protein NERG_00199 [Nematocida ausubeli]KAI5147444.1 protein YIPF5/7 [Nematocida ausubeli]